MPQRNHENTQKSKSYVSWNGKEKGGKKDWINTITNNNSKHKIYKTKLFFYLKILNYFFKNSSKMSKYYTIMFHDVVKGNRKVIWKIQLHKILKIPQNLLICVAVVVIPFSHYFWLLMNSKSYLYQIYPFHSNFLWYKYLSLALSLPNSKKPVSKIKFLKKSTIWKMNHIK